MRYLYDVCKVFSVAANGEQIEMIAMDIMSEYSYLKITEIMLFFLMFRTGQFRYGDADRGKMYGYISAEVISDCLFQFRRYRREILEKWDRCKREVERAKEEEQVASPEERFRVMLGMCLANHETINNIKKFGWLMEDELKKIETAIAELKDLRLLRQRVKEHLDGSDLTDVDKLRKAIEYLDNKYPQTQKDWS